MTTSLADLTRSLQQQLAALEKPLLAEFVDDQKLAEAHGRGDEGAAAKARVAAQQDNQQVRTAHEAALAVFSSWKIASSREGLAQDADSAEKLLRTVQQVTTQMALVEGRYAQLTAALAQAEASGDAAALAQAYSVLQSWREGAHELTPLVRAFIAQEEQVVVHAGQVFEGQLDPSRFTDIKAFRSGGVSTIESALDRKGNRRVLLKTYKDYLGSESDDAQAIRSKEASFANQLSTTGKVDIPGVERTLGFFFKRDEHGLVRPVVVTEFIEGETLSQVRARGAANDEYVRKLFEGVGPILQKLLENGVVHRDVSPDNIIVRPAGAPTSFAVIDFHNAISAPHGKTGTILGQSHFAPIELLHKGYADATTPFFSLARTGLGMLLPSDEIMGDLIIETMGRELNLEQDAADLAKRITPQLAHVIERATAHDKTLRYTNWSDMSHDLTSWRPGQMTLRERLSNAKKVLGTSTGKWGAFWGALSGKTRVTQRQLVTSAAPVDAKAIPAGTSAKQLANPEAFLLPPQSVAAGPNGRFKGSVDSSGRRLLYPQEQFAIMKKWFVDKDPAYERLADELSVRWDWTGVAIRRTDSGFDVWYDPVLVWDDSKNEFVAASGVVGGSQFSFPAVIGQGWQSIVSLPPQFAFFWGDAFDAAKAHKAELLLPLLDDRCWKPVARSGGGGYPWALLGDVIRNEDFGSRWVDAPKRNFGPSGVLAPVVEKTKWVLPLDKVQRGGLRTEEFGKACNRLRSTGKRHAYPREYFETRKYALESKDSDYVQFVKDAWSRWEWCDVAFEWSDKGFFILLSPNLVLDGNRYVEAGAPRQRIQVDASGLKIGPNALGACPAQLQALYGAALDIAKKEGGLIDIKKGVWPVSHYGDYGSPWSLSADYAGSYDVVSRWVGVEQKDFE